MKPRTGISPAFLVSLFNNEDRDSDILGGFDHVLELPVSHDGFFQLSLFQHFNGV